MNEQSISASIAEKSKGSDQWFLIIMGAVAGSILTFALMMGGGHYHGQEEAHDMSMTSMTKALEEKNGEEFDKAFLELMIEHHQGAVDTASEVLQKANHAELKAFAENIIAVQTHEIDTMKTWQQAWGYTGTEAAPSEAQENESH
jgi:hypothetical protein